MFGQPYAVNANTYGTVIGFAVVLISVSLITPVPVPAVFDMPANVFLVHT